MTCNSCVSPPSRIGQEPPSIGPCKDWLIMWASETCPQNTYWSSWRQHYSCRNQWQLLGPMALPWFALSPTTSCYINGTKLYEESSLGLHDEWEHLRTAPFGASSMFGDLANKLQLWDKVDSQQRDNALYSGSKPFAIGKHVLLHIDQHRLRPCHNGMLLCRCRPHVHIPFWPVGDVVQEVSFANQENDDTGHDYLCPRT